MAKRRKLLHQKAPPRPARPQQKDKGPKKPAKKQQQHLQHDEPVIPFSPRDRILLVGEADLSFAASIIQHHGCTNVTATVLEKDHAELVAKYPAVDTNIAVVNRRPDADAPPPSPSPSPSPGAGSDAVEDDAADLNSDEESQQHKPVSTTTNNKNTLIYNVDATKFPPAIARTPHDRIIFNFPHVGGKSTDVNRQVRHNQELLVSFFERAVASPAAPLARGGSVVVTLFESEPYTLWNIRDLGRHAGLQLERSFRFQPAAYPGYRHARTFGVVRNKKGEESSGWKGEERPARSFVFMRKGEVEDQTTKKKKRKRGGGDDSSSDDDED